MAMREDCRHFESRKYDDGEIARFCVLDLAPEAPWRCPENCPKYERSLVDSSLEQGSLARPPVEAEPDAPGDAIGDLLDDAESIVESAEPGILRELAAKRPRTRKWWQPWKRRHEGGDEGGEDGDDWRLSSR